MTCRECKIIDAGYTAKGFVPATLILCPLHESAGDILDVMEVLLGYAESKESDGGKRPLAHMAEARAILRAVKGDSQ